jgi:myo-inositol-1(or 4)-monophosphatase
MRTPPQGSSLLPGMIRAAHAAGRIQRKYWAQMEKLRTRGGPNSKESKKIGIREKPEAGLVTLADIESERICVKILHQLRPDFSFLTEEKTIAQTQGQGRWVIDPLDGTTNFVHGFPMFCVSLAAVWEGQVIAGVIYHPILKDTYSAALGKGAKLNGKKLHVSHTSTLEDSLLTTGFTYRKNALLHMEMQAFEELSRVARAVRRPGSAALDLAYTARGVFDGFWERNLAAWDIAAGSLLVTEAGGKVTNFKGDPLTLDQPAIVATNSRLHDHLLNAIAVDLTED